MFVCTCTTESAVIPSFFCFFGYFISTATRASGSNNDNDSGILSLVATGGSAAVVVMMMMMMGHWARTRIRSTASLRRPWRRRCGLNLERGVPLPPESGRMKDAFCAVRRRGGRRREVIDLFLQPV
ncbi:hypothetical protein BC939DRAFT_46927 [Gamsiella multidivaricata]|uniref:uncharacterized protein n=1 Tax=Gamsiella multidivaricata TaxID=101098 RepID=UPI002220A549|nr:uncharacterized protein BC939DRAFT_46927 [Gamsiella multidivaricata]KAI7816353.1 hypothetical protein BC939DRAFT_46927 [Gamsiella multidivaricata]